MGDGDKNENLPKALILPFFVVSDTYVVLEMDSYGHFFKKAKTKPARGQDPVWDEVCEKLFCKVASQCYSIEIKLFKSDFSIYFLWHCNSEIVTSILSF